MIVYYALFIELSQIKNTCEIFIFGYVGFNILKRSKKIE